jgi:hypothetical protein
MPDNPLSMIKEVGGVFRFGSGLLGKSAIVVAILLACVGIAVFRLHSDLAILGAILLGAFIAFGWYIPLIKFADKHPDVALLEGAEWGEYQRLQMEAKNFTPTLEEQRIQISSGGISRILSTQNGERKTDGL